MSYIVNPDYSFKNPNEGVQLPQKAPDKSLSDLSWMDDLNVAGIQLLEVLPAPSDMDGLVQATKCPTPLLDGEEFGGLPQELRLYRTGEYLSSEAKQRAQERYYRRPFTPLGVSPSRSTKEDRQQRIRHAEEIIVNRYPLRADGDQLYLCESSVWNPVTMNQFWRSLRASDLSQEIDAESFTDYDVKELNHRLITNASINFEACNPMDLYSTLINLQDICFHVTTGQYRPQDPSYFFTSKLDIWKSDLANKEAPYFEEFVQTSLDGNPALRQLLLEILGTLLSNYRPKTIFVFCGASNSGKSVLADFLRWILGVPAITQIAHLRDFSLRWTIGNLKGKKLLVCTECEDESIGTDACAVIKTITGEPVLTGEQKHKDATTFRNTVRLLLVSNHLVRLDRVDAGFANRLVSLPFPRTIPPEEQDPDLLEHLLQEKGPIFNMAMQALRNLIARNFAYTEIDSSYLDQVGEQQLHMAANFESGVYDFIQMCCTIAPDAFVPSGELYRRYQSYTQANGRPAYTKTNTRSSVLCRLYPTLTPTKRYVEGKQCRCLEGIMLSAPSETNQHQKEESSHD